MKFAPLFAAILLVAVATSGCFGQEGRTEWAFNVTQLDDLAGERTGKGVRIAILDTGVDTGHKALKKLTDGTMDNGEIVAFRDFYTGVTGVDNTFDDNGHGTHVTGIIAARSAGVGDKLIEGVELRGGAPNAQLIIGRVCNADSCRGSAIAQAVDWAVANGADIISMSLGSNPSFLQSLTDAQSRAMETSISNAINRGVLIVASAGNDASSEDDVAFPSNIKDVIAVGAVDKNLEVASFSQGGDSSANQCTSNLLEPVGRCDPNKKPELVAPGVDILSTWIDGTYARAQGTSQATPFVAAAAALILEGRPNLTNAGDVRELKTALVNSASDLDGQRKPHDNYAGYGLLQAQGALALYK